MAESKRSERTPRIPRTVGYYRQYISEFATIAHLLHRLTAKKEPWRWTEREQIAFNALKDSISTAPILGYLDPRRQYILDIGASGCGVGAVLSQVQEGCERVIAYYSKTLTSSERNYCVTQRELLAVVKAVKHFRPYLYGQEFLLRTDHASLRWLCRRRKPSNQVARWLEILTEFRYVLEHRSGIHDGNADELSRQTCEDCRQCTSIEQRDGGPLMEGVGKGTRAVSRVGTDQLPRWDSCSRQRGINLGQRRIPRRAGRQLAQDSRPNSGGIEPRCRRFLRAATSHTRNNRTKGRAGKDTGHWTKTRGHHVSCHRHRRRGASGIPGSREQRAGYPASHARLSAYTTGRRAESTRSPAGPRQMVRHLPPGHAEDHGVANARPGSLWGGKNDKPPPTDLVLAWSDVHSQAAHQEL